MYIPRFNLSKESTPALILGLVFFSVLGLFLASTPLLEYFAPRRPTRDEIGQEMAKRRESLMDWARQNRSAGTPMPLPPPFSPPKRESQKTVRLETWKNCAGGILVLFFTVRPIARELRLRRRKVPSGSDSSTPWDSPASPDDATGGCSSAVCNAPRTPKPQ